MNIFAVFNRKKTATEMKPGKVELVIIIDRKHKKYISTDIFLFPGQWDSENRMVVQHSQARELNKKINNLIRYHEELFVTMQKQGREMSVEALSMEIKAKKESEYQIFDEFARMVMEERKMRDSTRRAHLISLDALKESKCIRTIQDVTPENIARFDRWLRLKDREQTTIHNYHKRIKVYINEAIRRGLLDVSPYTKFKDVRGKSKERVALNELELNRVRTVELTDPGLIKARDLFVFCCFTGLSYADLERFSMSDVVERNGKMYIDGQRWKTGTRYYTPILPPARVILEKYNGDLPRMTSQAYNRLLRMIKEIAGIKTPITSHIARHTFATTVLLANDVSIETASRMLGHTRIQVTQIYAKIVNTSVERQADKLFSVLE